MRDFQFCYDAYLNLEEPDLYLAGPNKEFLGHGAIPIHGLSAELYFNNISSISFTCHYMENGAVNEDYEKLLEGNLILVRKIGWFQITEPRESGVGPNKAKSVTALSLENEFCSKYFTSFGSMGSKEDWDGGLDLYYLWNEALPAQSILHIMLEKLPAWKVGYIDPTIPTEPRSFQEDRIDAYTFLTKNVSEAYGCLFIFDTFEMAVNVYNPDNLGTLSSLYFSHHNLVKQLDKTVNLGDIKTVLYVEGGQYGSTSLGISEVSPTGSNYLYNFDYFKPRMSMELQQRLDSYEKEYKKKQELYQKYLITDAQSLYRLYERLGDLKNRAPSFDVQQFNERILALEEDIDKEADAARKESLRRSYLALVNEKLAFLKNQAGYVSAEWDLYGSVELQAMFDAYNGVLALFAGKKDSISLQMYQDAYQTLYGSKGIANSQKARKAEIAACQEKIKEVEQLLAQAAIHIRAYLGEALYKELSHFVYEDTFTDTSFVATAAMTDLERLNMERAFYEEAQKTLARISRPTPTFTLDSMDFAAIKEWAPLAQSLRLGDFATVELKENTAQSPSETVEVRLLKIAMNWEANDFSLTFSSATSLDEGKWQLAQLRDQAQGTANSLALHGSGWNYSSNQSSFVRDFMLSPLNAALNKLKSSQKEEVTIDNSGIHCREYNADTGTYSEEELWITRNLICFSHDAFNTVCTALGKVELNGKELYGLVAQYVYGSLMAGQNLIISNENGTFIVNGAGVTIRKLDLTVENDSYKIVLGNLNGGANDDIFTIWRKDGSSLTKQLYFNNGDLTITGMLNALAGSKFGNWVIGADSIYYKYNSFGHGSGMYFGKDGLSIGNKFKVDKEGNLYATTGDYSGKISSTSGNIGGWAITSSGLSGNGAITGGTINGASITASNSVFTNALLKSCRVSGDLTANDANITVVSSSTGNQMRLAQGRLTTNGAIGIYNNDIYCRMLYIDSTSDGLDKTSSDGKSLKAYINETLADHLSTESVAWNENSNGNGIFDGGIAASTSWVLDNFERSSSSDLRLKKNLRKLDSSYIELLRKLKLYSYQFKDQTEDSLTHYGVLAQEVLSAMEEAGIDQGSQSIVQKYNARPYKDEGMYTHGAYAYRVDYRELSNLLLLGWQDLDKRLSRLEQALKGQAAGENKKETDPFESN